MHLSAALLLLLIPATRAAAIPNQGDLFGAGDALTNKGELANPVLNAVLKGDHVDGSATARRDEAANLLTSIGNAHAKSDETVSKTANNPTAKRNAPLGNKDVELPVTLSGLDDTLDLFVFLDKHGKRLAQRDDADAQLREYIAETFKDLNPEQAEQLLADLLAAYKGNNPIASRDTTGTDSGVINIVEYVEDIAGEATRDVAVPKNSQSGGTPFVPIGRRNLEVPFVTTIAEPSKTAIDDSSADLVAQIAKANPQLSLKEVKAMVADITGAHAFGYEKRDGEDPLADLIAHIAKENPNLSLEEVKELVAAMAEGVGAKYVKRDGEVVAGGLGHIIPNGPINVEGASSSVTGEVKGLANYAVIFIGSDQLLNQDDIHLNGKRDTTGDNIDATNIIGSATETAAGVVGEVSGAGLKGAAEDKEAKIDNVKAYSVNKHTGEVRELSPEEIKKLVAGLTPGSAKARRDDPAVLLAHLGAEASDTATGTPSARNVARASILVEAVVEGGKGGKGKGRGKGKGKGKEDKSKGGEE